MDIVLALIKDMNSTFATCVVAIVASFTIIVCVFRSNRSDEIARRKRDKEFVRRDMKMIQEGRLEE